MIELIDKIYNSQEIDDYLRYHIERSFDSLIQRTSSAPFCDKDGFVKDENALNHYIDRLRELGQSIDQRYRDSLDLFSSQVDSIIGRLLAKFPLNKDYPQTILCEILERLNSKYVNSSFYNELCELNILHMRAPGDGGRIEKPSPTDSNNMQTKFGSASSIPQKSSTISETTTIAKPCIKTLKQKKKGSQICRTNA